MNRITLIALLALAVACKVEKTGQDTYKVVAPTPQAKAAAKKAEERTATAVDKLGKELKEVGNRVKAKSETMETGTKTETRTKATTRY